MRLVDYPIADVRALAAAVARAEQGLPLPRTGAPSNLSPDEPVLVRFEIASSRRSVSVFAHVRSRDGGELYLLLEARERDRLRAAGAETAADGTVDEAIAFEELLGETAFMKRPPGGFDYAAETPHEGGHPADDEGPTHVQPPRGAPSTSGPESAPEPTLLEPLPAGALLFAPTVPSATAPPGAAQARLAPAPPAVHVVAAAEATAARARSTAQPATALPPAVPVTTATAHSPASTATAHSPAAPATTATAHSLAAPATTATAHSPATTATTATAPSPAAAATTAASQSPAAPTPQAATRAPSAPAPSADAHSPATPSPRAGAHAPATPSTSAGARSPGTPAPSAAARSPGTPAPSGSAPPTTPTSPIGRTLGGKFLIEAEIGSGAMGTVFRARQLSLDKVVAVKILMQELTQVPTFVARFHQEARAAATLDHPNCVRVIDFGTEPDGLLYLAMEYVQGRDLAALISLESPLGDVRIAQIATQVLNVLARAHDAGIVHRDLKPENILVLSRPGEEGEPVDVIKICDFGIAVTDTVPANRVGLPRLTAKGLIVGTPEYMSPEQAQGDPVDLRSDLYSLGVVLYYMLTERLPFEGDTALKVILEHVTSNAPPPSTLNGEISPRWDKICMTAMEKDPQNRYPSARAMRADVTALLAEKHETSPSRVTPVATATFVAPEGRRRSGAAAALGVAMVMMIAAVFAHLRSLAQVDTVAEASTSAGVVPGASAMPALNSQAPNALSAMQAEGELALERLPASAATTPVLRASYGRLFVPKTAGCVEVRVDDVDRGTTPRVVDLPAGAHEVACIDEHGATKGGWARVETGAALSVAVKGGAAP